ncbi:MAG: Ig-like domain-containing protein, partial [Candidatus Methanomethylophilaceae archaeon]|nr:Ig-like domain-containing protein [Candidatus Methanomethylophilaceae archaeon]
MNYDKATMKGRGPKALMLVVVLLIVSFTAATIVVTEVDADEPTYTISPETATIYINGTVSLSVNGLASGNTVVWISNQSAATVSYSTTASSTCVVTGVSKTTGTGATITATIYATGDHEGDSIGSATCTVVVKKAVTGVDIRETKVAVEIGATPQVTLHADVTPDDASVNTLQWSSATPSVATIGQSTGTITAVAVGTSVITVKSVDNQSKTDTITINVIKKVESLTLSDTSLNLYKNSKESENSKTIGVTISPSDITYRDWSSSNTSVATVSNDGKVTAVGAGT